MSGFSGSFDGTGALARPQHVPDPTATTHSGSEVVINELMRCRAPQHVKKLPCTLRYATLRSAHALHGIWASSVPRPYLPPVAKRTQAVSSAGGSLWQRWKWWWVIPLGLVPIFVVAALASRRPIWAREWSPWRAHRRRRRRPARRLDSHPGTANNHVPERGHADRRRAAPGRGRKPRRPGRLTPQAVARRLREQRPQERQPARQHLEPGQLAPGQLPPGQLPPGPLLPTLPLVAPRPARPRPRPPDRSRPIASRPVTRSASSPRCMASRPPAWPRPADLLNADRLSVGQVLTIPNQPGYLYRLQPGETLDQIAARTGVASNADRLGEHADQRAPPKPGT